MIEARCLVLHFAFSPASHSLLAVRFEQRMKTPDLPMRAMNRQLLDGNEQVHLVHPCQLATCLGNPPQTVNQKVKVNETKMHFQYYRYPKFEPVISTRQLTKEVGFFSYVFALKTAN